MTIRQSCSIVGVLNKKKEEEIEAPGELQKKKSRSIDNSQKYQSVSISKNKGKTLSKNHSVVGSMSKGHLMDSIQKPLYKKSLDLTESELNEIEMSSPLRNSTQEIKMSDFGESSKKSESL